MKMRGVRGAITVDANTSEAILDATCVLLQAMIDTNGINEEDVASVIFTTTPNLNATYPAKAARALGWTQTALMGCLEIDVPDGLSNCVRILVHWNTSKTLSEIRHVFLRGAAVLRPDLSPQTPAPTNGRDRS